MKELSIHIDIGLSYLHYNTALKPVNEPKKKIGLSFGLMISENKYTTRIPWVHIYLGYHWRRPAPRKIARFVFRGKKQEAIQ